MLLSRLHEELVARGQTCWWVSLDDRDADLSSVLYKIRAAQRQAPDEGVTDSNGIARLFPDRGAPVDGVLQLLAQQTVATTLFIDNLGCCTDDALAPFLERLVFGTPAGLRVVLASTQEIPVDTVRAKLETTGLELRAPQLSFDRISTARLLRQAGVAPIDDTELDRILAHTEGWPAAVRLLQVLLVSETDAAHMGTAPDFSRVLHRFSGDHGDIARVLTRRVLVGFDPDLVQFMIEIALVREFNPELAAHMTGRPEAREWLNLLVERNVLIFPLDHNRRWFRFHTLLREFLVAEGRECVVPKRRRDVLNLAAQWHVEQGDNVTAIAIALEAGATDLARGLVDRIAHVVVGDHGQMATLIQWVDHLQSVDVTPSLEAHAWFVWALCDSLQYERARQALDDLDRRMASQALGPDDVPSRLLFVRMLVSLWVDRPDTAFEQAERWLARGDATDALALACAMGIASIIEVDRGDLTAARARLARADAVIARSVSAYGMAWLAIIRACMEISQGRPDLADEVLAKAHAHIGQVIGDDASVIITLDFVRARALLDLGRMDAARTLAQRGLSRAMNHGILASLEQGMIACVAFWHDQPDDVVSGALLEKVAHCYPARGQMLLAVSQVRRLIQLGRSSDALTLAERNNLSGGSAGTPATAMQERGDWLLARLELLLVQGACDDVLAQIDALLKTARHQDRHRDRIELLLLAADAHQRLGQLRMAVRHFSMAIVLATPGKLVQPFKARQGLVGNILSETSAKDFGLTRATEWSFLERLRPHDNVTQAPAGLDSAAAEEAAPAVIGVPTLREIQLLALLDQGLNNEQVADRLSLSVPTVKWHLHNVYVKLGVRSRSAALARARALNLINK